MRPARAADRDAVVALLESEGLEAEFAEEEFLVAEREGKIAACVRLKPLPGGGSELASVAVAKPLRGQRLGDALVRAALAQARGPVFALALAPGFFARHGFVPSEVPPALAEKAHTVCASKGFVAMARR